MDFKEWFCLKNRESFTIDPKISTEDAKFYFGRPEIDKKLKAQIRKSFIAPGTPKLMVWGPYGSGKTQTLFYVEHYLRTDKPASCKLEPLTLHLDVEVHSKSFCSDLHIQLLECLGKDQVTAWIKDLFDRSSDLKEELRKICEDPNTIEALQELRDKNDLMAWRWITGQNLSTKELETLGITRNLGQVGAGDMVNALITIAKLSEANGKKLIFLIDEMEELQNVKTGDATESIHQYVRKLSDTANSYVGYIIGFKSDTLNDAPEILVRGDIRSRISEINYIEISHLPAISDVKLFIKEMLAQMIDIDKAAERISAESLETTPEAYPFTETSFDMLCDYASQDPVKALPRNIINSINECAIQAWDEQKKLIDPDIVDEIGNLVFA